MSDDPVLKVEQVRWFYRDSTNKRWIPFNGYDSINLELDYRSRLVCDKSDCLFDQTGSKICNSEHPSVNHKVSVRGGLYEADIDGRCCVPTYWPVERCPTRILRGTWFREGYGGTLEPFDDELMAERLEAEYITWYTRKNRNVIWDKPLYSSSSLFTRIDVSTPLHSVVSAPTLQYADTIKTSESVAENSQSSRSENKDSTIGVENYSDDNVCGSTVPKKRVPCQTIQFTDCHVDCYGENELYLYYESTSLYIRQKLGMQKVGTRLCRGFNDLALKEDKIADISHLCFVIHGIGQKMGTNLVLNNCNELRDTCDKIKSRYFSHLDKENKRVEFLPVEWRTVLQLDGDTVESITPVHLRGFRTVLNSSAMDIMYYTSPLYRAEIICSLKSELNRLYDMFRRLNPDFESRGGKVSIIAHSLGCVLVYDLITGWNQVPDNDPLTEILLNKSTDKKIFSNSASTKLSDITDKLENLFCLGSPLGVYLVLRGIRPGPFQTQDSILPRKICRRIFNIYHPADPVAYRLEPLILKYYSTVQPALIHRVDAASKPCYDTLPLLEYSGKEFKHPKPHNCRVINPCSDTNQLITTQEADSSRPLSIASRLFGFFSRAPYLPGGSQETGGIDLNLSEKIYNHDNDEKINSMEKCSEFCNSTNKKEQKTKDSLTSSLSSTDLLENDLCCHDPLQLECRLDFQLQASRYENMYISLLTSHTSYWTNADICMFIMTYLFPLQPGSTD
ncbi:putative phospholipase DDHD1 [Schistosoma mansoni]|uniref:putative phospholipase DDHD1 n=1 Tax=Schistosoma mansoni TaxID=6183 RepID=UPI0001A94496|nr:putative phospholipase DDHD1 [Schistosoma mansoni]|eukprot:XP_018647905.1 putative phospholipase DDHD1 [Schistosoma mansoni]